MIERDKREAAERTTVCSCYNVSDRERQVVLFSSTKHGNTANGILLIQPVNLHIFTYLLDYKTFYF